jgi:hypothetical protein
VRKLVARTAVLVLILSYAAFAKPKQKTYDYPAKQVFEAALRTAREHQVVTFIDHKNLLLTFETGTSLVSYGFNANASVESDGPSKSTLIINVQKKNVGKDASFAWGAGGRMADKFFEEVSRELTQMPKGTPDATSAAPAPASATNPSSAVPAVGTVNVSSVPQGAEIDVDGAFVGDSPASLKLPSGKHTVSVSEKGYKPWTRDLLVLAGSSTKLDVSLADN